MDPSVETVETSITTVTTVITAVTKSEIEPEEPTAKNLVKAEADAFPALPPHNISLNLVTRQVPKPEQAQTSPDKSAWSYRNPAVLAAPRFPLPAPSQPQSPRKYEGQDTSFDFPFLVDEATKQYLSRKDTKLMLILRGTPGSGKSTLCKKIVEILGDLLSVRVVSADHFFHQPDGRYTWNAEQLPVAHEKCKATCEKWCQTSSEAQLIIVDNTNITIREFMPYLWMAHRYNYVTILLEPRTPWRYEPAECKIRNIHNVAVDKITDRLRSLQENFVSPLYYGWMISANDSGKLKAFASKLVKSMLQAEVVIGCSTGETKSLAEQFAEQPEKELLEWKQKQDLQHVTAFYTANGKQPGVKEYEAREGVQNNLGKVTELHVAGLLVTTNTLSFRVKLTLDQLKLWNQEEVLTSSSDTKAHITIATAKGVMPAVAGSDITKLRDLMVNSKPEMTISIAAGRIMKFTGDVCYLALDKPISISALFAAFYSRCRDREPTSAASPPSVSSPVRSGTARPTTAFKEKSVDVVNRR